MRPQFDNRIRAYEVGSFTHAGKRFVVNLRPGVPRNACVEVDPSGAFLRCWASHQMLDAEAADFVRDNAVYQPQTNCFVWKDGIRVREVRKG